MSARRARLGWFLGAAWIAAVLLVPRTDVFGDRGMRNVLKAGLVLLGALVLLVRFLARRTVPLRARLAVLAALALLGVLFAALVRVSGVSGELVPSFEWRFAAAPAPVPAAGGAALDLGVPGPHDFPAFLGPRGDNTVPDARLAADWAERPPVLRWRGPIGAGWAAFAVAGNWAFTLEQAGGAQRASARALADGTVGWSVPIDEPFEHVLGGDGPRATPAVVLDGSGGHVYVQSAWGKLLCLDAASGAVVWRHDLAAEHGLTRAREIELAQYGRSSSPLVAGELVIVPAGGDPARGGAGLVAFERASGALRWRSPPRHFSYSTPALATLGGVAQVLCVNEDTVTGHALADGRILWEHPWPGRTSENASVSQAVPLPPDRVLVSKGYGEGGCLLALEPAGDGFVARVRWHERRQLRTKFTNVVVHDGHVYGLDDGMLECVELETGAKRWKEGRYGHGQVLLAGGLLLLCSEEGEVFLIAPDPERPNDVRASFQALEGKCWAHLALAGSLLLVRSAETCAAWELPLAE